jgi:hypothetical protein
MTVTPSPLLHLFILLMSFFFGSQARKRWSLFYFFVKRIEGSMANGKTSSEAVLELEDLRVNQALTMSQLHRSLQPKKQKTVA